MNFNNYTIKAQEAIQQALQIASENKNQAIEPIHLLKGILTVDENVFPFILKKANINLTSIQKLVDAQLKSLPTSDQYHQAYLPIKLLEEMKSRNFLGRKSGSGFYKLVKVQGNSELYITDILDLKEINNTLCPSLDINLEGYNIGNLRYCITDWMENKIRTSYDSQLGNQPWEFFVDKKEDCSINCFYSYDEIKIL